MAEVDTKSEVIESKVNEPKNEDGDESKENEDGDESKENEDGGKSLENTPKPKRTPLKSMPLYDSPLTQSGKRVRTPVPQFVIEKKEEFVYEFNGVGVALGEIPYIEFMINKELPDALKKLHSVCFSRTGEMRNVKKNLRQFNGFSYDKTDKKYEAKKTNMDRYFKPDLGLMCKVLGLEVAGMKTDVIDRILEFVLKPQDNNKSLPGKKKKKSGKKKKKSGNRKERSDKGKKKERKSKGGDTESDSAVNDENDSTANDTADSSDSGSESENEEKPKKTPAKKPAKTPAKKVATKTPAKKTPAKKTPAKKAPAKKTPAKRSKSDVDSDSDSSDDEPLIKKTKSPPTNDEIKKKVEEILEGADLEEVTMKSVCKQIYEIYPGFDLTDRKSFIKETVKAVLG